MLPLNGSEFMRKASREWPGACLIIPFLLLPLAAETHTVVGSQYYNTFSRSHPVLLRIRPGDTVRTQTLDSGGQDDKGAHLANPSNPLTGPFFIEGAQPGDAIAVRLNGVRLNRNWGYSAWRLGLFSLLPSSIEGLYSDKFKENLVRQGHNNIVRWNIDLDRKMVRLSDPASRAIQMEFPAHPMLGCIGVAPTGDFAPTSTPAGSYGGNLDFNMVAEGASVILPVYQPGGLLFLGDGHALMADGEPTGTGIETSMDVEFTVELQKQVRIAGPRLENADYLVSIGAQPEFVSPLDRGLQIATSDMVNWLVGDYHLEPWAAHVLVGFQGEYRVVTVAGTIALLVPKKALQH
jgi:acetamidase/formamidase